MITRMRTRAHAEEGTCMHIWIHVCVCVFAEYERPHLRFFPESGRRARANHCGPRAHVVVERRAARRGA